jgi:Na+-driven multidrug efflux pump
MDPQTEDYTGQRRWPRLWQDVAIVAWPSFLVAAVATMICFAFIDPVLIGNDDYPPPAFASRMTGYAVGFFFFWLISALSSLLTLYLARTEKPGPPGTAVPDQRERSSQ